MTATRHCSMGRCALKIKFERNDGGHHKVMGDGDHLGWIWQNINGTWSYRAFNERPGKTETLWEQRLCELKASVRKHHGEE